jgi:iron(III) transport system permease protein
VSLASPSSGLLNELLRAMGAPEWMRFNIMSVGGIIFVKAAHYVPYGYLFLAGTLRNTDASLEEAAYVAGSNVPRTAFNIVLPLLRASALSAVLFISILAAGEFTVSAILGVRTNFVPLAVHIYQAIYGFPQDYGRAAAIGTLVIVISIVAFYFYRRSMRDSQRFVTVTGRGFAIRKIDPGRYLYPILIMFAIYTFVTVILPYGSLIFMAFAKFRTGSLATTHFTFETIRTVLTSPEVPLATFNSLVISAIVPVACVVFSLVLVYANDRLRVRGSEAANYIAQLPVAISGIVFGTGIFVIYIRSPLYGTIWLIVLGLVATYMTHAVRIISNGLHQIDRPLEEAASINGAHRNAVLRTIVAPLLRPSLFSALILVFVFCIREVNTTILLYSPSSLTLSVVSWNYANDGYLASASVVGLLQSVLMLVVIVIARLGLGVQATKNTM